MIKICVNCDFYSKSGQCGALGSIRHIDPVTGKILYESASNMRAKEDMCSDEGKWFVEKVKPVKWYHKTIFGISLVSKL